VLLAVTVLVLVFLLQQKMDELQALRDTAAVVVSEPPERSDVLAQMPPSADPAAPCVGCNVVFITVDTLRADRASRMPRTARRFAERGRYPRARTASPCTVPSVRQILTSSYHGKNPTLSAVLQRAGYATSAVVSQQHLGPGSGHDEGFSHYDVQGVDEVTAHGMSTRTATDVSDRGVQWLDTHGSAGPFMLWLHYYDPHDPYWPPAAYREGIDVPPDAVGGDRRALQQAAAAEQKTKYYLVDDIFNDAQRRAYRALYDAEVHYVDQEIDRVLAKVEALGLWEKTVVVLTSDHGERLGAEGVWDHCITVADLEVDVPLWIWAPGAQWEGTDQVVSALDAVPTVLDLLGYASLLPKMGGASLLRPGRDRLIASVWQGKMVALLGEHRLVYRYEAHEWIPARLSLRTESGWTPVALESAPRVVQAFDDEIAGAPTLGIEVHALAQDTLERLRSLGYTQ
jgi:hypothetical protein